MVIGGTIDWLASSAVVGARGRIGWSMPAAGTVRWTGAEAAGWARAGSGAGGVGAGEGVTAEGAREGVGEGETDAVGAIEAAPPALSGESPQVQDVP
ncbi:hypothetical protein [Kocuria oceani]|uniref:Uncharacterized protein n=1 Tax=Kocuria oceani TaxID=988827 RepID=A0ABV9TEX6_9MICC|nr:hypothetical protein [Kocuria oceani]